MKTKPSSDVDKKRKGGLTLIELLIVVAIVGIMMGIGIEMLMFPLQQYEALRAEQEVLSDLRRAERILSRDIRCSSSAVLSASTEGQPSALTVYLLASPEDAEDPVAKVKYAIRPDDSKQRFVPSGPLYALWRSEIRVKDGTEEITKDIPIYKGLTHLDLSQDNDNPKGLLIRMKAGLLATKAHKTINVERDYAFFAERREP